MSAGPLLLLWDIDGTLLQRASTEHARALREAAMRVHGLDGLDHVAAEYAGRTDAAILRDLLRLAGVTDEAIDAQAAAVRSASAEAFARLCPDDLSGFVAPGVPEVLAALAARDHRQALLTGNFEPIGRLKIERAGLGAYFEAGQGAFGSDSASRADLPAIARRRAGSWPRERTVVIGDTPRDIACARADEVRVVAVATGPFGIEQLADADAVVDDARAVLPVLEDWATAPA